MTVFYWNVSRKFLRGHVSLVNRLQALSHTLYNEDPFSPSFQTWWLLWTLDYLTPPDCLSNGSWTVLLWYIFIFKLFLTWNIYFLVGTWKLYMLQKNDNVVCYFTFYNYSVIGQSADKPFGNQPGSLIKLLWHLKRLELIHKAWWLFWYQHYFMNRSTSFIFFFF